MLYFRYILWVCARADTLPLSFSLTLYAIASLDIERKETSYQLGEVNCIKKTTKILGSPFSTYQSVHSYSFKYTSPASIECLSRFPLIRYFSTFSLTISLRRRSMKGGRGRIEVRGGGSRVNKQNSILQRLTFRFHNSKTFAYFLHIQ